MTITLIIIGWLACGFVASGLLFAYVQREFGNIAHNYVIQDRTLSLIIGGACGPIGLCAAMLVTGCGLKHGWLAPWRKP